MEPSKFAPIGTGHLVSLVEALGSTKELVGDVIEKASDTWELVGSLRLLSSTPTMVSRLYGRVSPTPEQKAELQLQQEGREAELTEAKGRLAELVERHEQLVEEGAEVEGRVEAREEQVVSLKAEIRSRAQRITACQNRALPSGKKNKGERMRFRVEMTQLQQEQASSKRQLLSFEERKKEHENHLSSIDTELSEIEKQEFLLHDIISECEFDNYTQKLREGIDVTGELAQVVALGAKVVPLIVGPSTTALAVGSAAGYVMTAVSIQSFIRKHGLPDQIPRSS